MLSQPNPPAGVTAYEGNDDTRDDSAALSPCHVWIRDRFAGRMRIRRIIHRDGGSKRKRRHRASVVGREI